MASYEQIKEVSETVNIVGGAVHPECIYLIAEEYYDEEVHGDGLDAYSFVGDFHIYMYLPKLKEKENDWKGKIYGGMKKMRKIAVIPNKNLAFCGVFWDGDVITQREPEDGAKGFKWTEGAIPTEKAMITDIAVIDDVVYASAGGGSVYRRIADDNWEEIALSTTERFFSGDRFIDGFDCIGGFSADEIYVGGDRGIMWLCDKGDWRPLDLPMNEDIEQIVCGTDGNVYLKGVRKLLKGRKDHWEVIEPNFAGNAMIRKIAWFKDRLYILPTAASALGLYTMDSDNHISQAPVGSIQINPDKIILDNPLFGLEANNAESKVFVPAGARSDMVANDDLLMITGNEEVILFNGERWFNLFDKNKTEEELRATGTFYDPREL